MKRSISAFMSLPSSKYPTMFSILECRMCTQECHTLASIMMHFESIKQDTCFGLFLKNSKNLLLNYKNDFSDLIGAYF